MFILQKYKGKSTRHTCPACGRASSFTLYINAETGKPVNPKVGKCNREIKCGYHYPPGQFFKDHPSVRRDAACHVSNISPHSIPTNYKLPTVFIPFHYLEQSFSLVSNFVSFLLFNFPEHEVLAICNKYLIGATRSREVIFWQVDAQGRVRTGKIMQYNPETGKRLKHASGAIDWVHNKLKLQQHLPQDFNLQQCFFGEHLLALYRYSKIAIVESEKSAIIAGMLMPGLVWLAAGNINGLSVEKCRILKGRDVILYPDLGAYGKWLEKAKMLKEVYQCTITVSTVLENASTPEAKANGLDLADYLLAQL